MRLRVRYVGNEVNYFSRGDGAIIPTYFLQFTIISGVHIPDEQKFISAPASKQTFKVETSEWSKAREFFTPGHSYFVDFTPDVDHNPLPKTIPQPGAIQYVDPFAALMPEISNDS